MSKADTPQPAHDSCSPPSLRLGLPSSEPRGPRAPKRASAPQRLWGVLALLWATALGLSQAHAADVPFDINRFQPALGTGRLVTLDLAEISPTLEVAPQLFVHYARDPMFLYVGSQPLFPLVHDRLTGDVGISVGIPIHGTGRIQLGLSLPVTMWQTGQTGDVEGLYGNTKYIDVLPTQKVNSAGLEDLRFQIKGVFVNGRLGGFGAAGDLTMPTGDKLSFLGNPLPTFNLRLLGHLNLGSRFTVALNVGWLFAEDRQVVFTNTGMSLSYGLGFAAKLAKWNTGSFDLIAEIYGFSYKNFESLGETPLEGSAALRLNLHEWHIYVGAGPGIPPNYNKGLGSPEYRIYGGLQWAWQKKPPKPIPPKEPPPPDCRCRGANCACTPGVNCPCTAGVNCRCTPGVDCPCTEGRDCACEEGKNCACTPGVNCPCTEGVDCLCIPGKNCPKKPIRLKGESFEFDSPRLTAEGEQTIRGEIDKLVEHLKQGGKIRIEGHTDNVGGMEYNTRLSKGRAKSVHELVVAELRSRGVAEDVLTNQVEPYAWFSYKCAAVPYSQRKGKTKLDKKLRDDENEPNRRIEINEYPDNSVKCFVPLPPQQ